MAQPSTGRPSFRSVPEMWAHRVASTPDLVAMRHRVGGRWVPVTWREADLAVREVAMALLELGLGHEDRAAILGETSIAWVIADMAILAAGGATTTIYPSEPDDTAELILADAEVRVLFCQDEARARALLTRSERLPALQRVVVFHGAGDGDRIVSLDAFRARGRAQLAAAPRRLAEVQAGIHSAHLATLIYTSGTTGRPKGVELTHDAWVYEAEAIDQLGVLGPDDEQLLFLPLAHVFAKVMQVTFIRLGITTAIDGSVDRFLENLVEVRPTWMAAVPRVFEKAWNRMHTEAEARGPAAVAVVAATKRLAEVLERHRREGRTVPLHLRLAERVADRVVFSRIRAAFGGRLRFCVSGGAPLSAELAAFFHAAGILICEGYGLTESAAASAVNRPGDLVFGTVGPPLPGCALRIADDGEILLRSRGVMRGYHNLPEATAEALDAQGWLHTGDIGRVLPSGHLQITDRKKDILVLAGGKNVAPARFQQALASRSPYVAHALMHGDRRNFCSALVSPDLEALRAWATREGLPAKDDAALLARPEVRFLVQQAIDDVNRNLPGYEQVRRWAFVPAPFTVEDGTLTPSLKVKRKEVERRYQAVLDGLYEGTVKGA